MGQYRGSYRSIAAVLVDGPNFQSLSPDAKLVFLVCKVALGPSGIEVVPSVAAATAERTGLSRDRVLAAFRELAAADWMHHEGNVLWITRGLEFEPHYQIGDRKHVAAVRRHVAGLPRIALVSAFISRYREWFEGAEGLLAAYPTPSKGQGRVIEGPSEALPRAIEAPMTDEEEPRTETEEEEPTRTAAFAAAFEDAWRLYPRRPNNARRKAQRAFIARLKAGIPPETLLAGVRAYAAYCERERVPPEFIKQAATFFGPDEHWAADYGAPPALTIRTYDENGEMTPEALRALGRSAA